MTPSQTVWDYIDSTASAVAANWLRLQALDPHRVFNLYYRRADGAYWGELAVGTSAPEGFDLACGTRIPPAWDIAQVRAFVHDVLISLPLIGTSPLPLFKRDALRANAA